MKQYWTNKRSNSMTTTALRHFDTLDYVEKSKALGVDENLAKYQARQIEQAIDIAVDRARTDIENKELATKHDIEKVETKIGTEIHRLETQIHKAKYEIIIWIVGFSVVSGAFQHFFK